MPSAKRHIKEPLKIKFRLISGFAALLIVGFAAYASLDKWPTWLAATEEFIAKAIDARVEHIMVSGVDQTDKTNLAHALGLKKGDSLVGFDASAARESLENLPWVRDAVVERKLPDTLIVKVYEYVPAARLLASDGVWVVDKSGNQISLAGDKFGSLTLMRGEGVENHVADLMMLLQLESDRSLPNIAEATYIGNRRWNLGFETNSTVLLPEKNPARALQILTKLQKSKSILNIEGSVVDLRLEDRIVLRMPQNSKKKERML